MEVKSYFFVLTRWSGGGIERIFENVARVVNTSNIISKIYLYVIDGFDEKKYQLDNNVFLLPNVSSLLKKYRKEEQKILINFNGDWKSSALCFFISREYISWVHCNPYIMKKAKTSFLNFCLLRKSKKVVCVCNEQKDILITQYNFSKEKVVTIYNSVDFETVKKRAVDKINFDSKFILMVARIDFSSKDFFTLINAYSLLSEELRKEYKLVFLGDGADKYKVKQYIEKKELDNQILLVGYDPNPYKWIKMASCFVLSSITEGFNVSVIEAMILKCPEVISNYHTSSFEVCDNEKNTLMFTIGNAKELADKITIILNNKSVRDKLVNNSTLFINRFSNDVFVTKIRNLLNV